MCVEGITTVYWYVTLSLQKQGFTGAVLAKALNDHGYNVQCAQGLTQLWQLAEAAAQMQQLDSRPRSGSNPGPAG